MAEKGRTGKGVIPSRHRPNRGQSVGTPL